MKTKVTVSLESTKENCALAKEYLHSKEFMGHLDTVVARMKEKKKKAAKPIDVLATLELNSKVYRG